MASLNNLFFILPSAELFNCTELFRCPVTEISALFVQIANTESANKDTRPDFYRHRKTLLQIFEPRSGEIFGICYQDIAGSVLYYCNCCNKLVPLNKRYTKSNLLCATRQCLEADTGIGSFVQNRKIEEVGLLFGSTL